MKNWWILTRVMVSNMTASMNPFNAAYDSQQKKSRAVMRAIGVAMIMLMAIGSVVYIEYLIYKVLTAPAELDLPVLPLQKQLALLPGLAIFISMMFTMVMGLFQGLSELFQGKDAPFLAVLPLTSRAIFAARMTTLYISEMLVNLLICVPAFVLYGIGQGSAWPVILTGLPVLLCLPLIPLAVVALVSSLLMRVSFVAKHREALTMFLSAALAIAYAAAVTLNNASSGNPAENLMPLLLEDGLVDVVLKRFPPAMWAVKGLGGDVPLLLLFIGVSAACTAAVIMLVGPGYLEQALSATERTVTHRAVRGAFRWNRGGAFKALHSLEWKEILRTPAWSYNALLGVVMFPLMIGIGLFAGLSNADVDGGLDFFRGIVRQPENCAYVILISAAVLCMGSMVNPAVSTAISREGGRWPFALTLPVRQETRFLAKMMVGLEINVVCILMIAVVGTVLIGVPVLWMLAACAIAMLVGTAAAAGSLWVDAMRPQLVWSSEMEAIKKNFNQIFGMLLWMALMALCAAAAVLLILWLDKPVIALLGCAAVALVEAAVCLLLLFRATGRHRVLRE